MLVGAMTISILCGLLSVAIAMLAGQSPLVWLLCYALAGICALLVASWLGLKGNPAMNSDSIN